MSINISQLAALLLYFAPIFKLFGVLLRAGVVEYQRETGGGGLNRAAWVLAVGASYV